MKTLKLSTLLLFGAILLLTGCDKDKDNDPIAVNSVVITPATLELNLGQTEQLTAKVSPDNADDKTVMWNSANQTIATVDASGKVTAVGLGQTTITVTAGGKSGNCTVTVKASTPLDNIDMDGKTTIQVKEAIQAALDAGITEFKLTGNIANSGMDGTREGSPFFATNITKIDLTGVTDWTAVECDGYNLTTETVAGLPASAFGSCTSLTEVKLPSEVKAIGAFAFELCSSLTTINLGSVTHVGKGAFGSCEALADVSLPEATTLYAGAFANTAFVSIYLPKVTAISVEPNANTSFWGSFKQCAQLTAVSAPLLTDIGNNTFSGCTKLKTIDIPNAATIGETAFQRCESLESITFDKVTTIGKQAFAFCLAVTTVDLPLAEEIGERAFWNCTALTEIALPKAALINLCAFSACTELKTLRLPAAKKIGNYIADGCSKLTLIEVTAAGELTSSEGTALNTSGSFGNMMTTPPFTSTTCDLVLNTDKKAGGTGVPLASGNTWANATWKSITFE